MVPGQRRRFLRMGQRVADGDRAYSRQPGLAHSYSRRVPWGTMTDQVNGYAIYYSGKVPSTVL